MATLDILERLIAFPTVSDQSNLDLIEYAEDLLHQAGAETWRVPDETGKKACLFGTLGPMDVPGVVLSGHSDVVPATGQSWSRAPFHLARDGGRLYGRGATDMKGFIASALALFERVDASQMKAPLHIALSYDEEVGCLGVRDLIGALKTRLPTQRACIVGEPTRMRAAIGHKGKVAGRIRCSGVAGHSARAPDFVNAIHLAADMIAALRALQEDLRRKGTPDPDAEIPYSTVHIGRIDGGQALNIVPDLCEILFEIRHLAKEKVSVLLHRLEGAAVVAGQLSPGGSVTVEVLSRYPAFETPPDAEVAAEVAGWSGRRAAPIKVEYGTEAGLFQRELNWPTIVCGPGDMAQGHVADEFIEQSELEACDRMMDRIAATLSAA